MSKAALYALGMSNVVQTVKGESNVSRIRNVNRLAILFSDRLNRALPVEIMQRIRDLNRQEKNPSVCHSHDFIDSNEVMAAAFEEVLGVECDPADGAHSTIWGDAWVRAQELEFPAIGEAHQNSAVGAWVVWPNGRVTTALDWEHAQALAIAPLLNALVRSDYHDRTGNQLSVGDLFAHLYDGKGVL